MKYQFSADRIFSLMLAVWMAVCAISCDSNTVRSAFAFSADATGQSYKTPFPHRSPTGAELGINMLLVFAKPFNLGSPMQFIDEPVNSSSSMKGYYGYAVMNPETTSDLFTDHLFYTGGTELILKRSGDGDDHTSLFYFEVPLHMVYVHPLNTGMVYGGLGPYFGYGIFGNQNDGNGNKVDAFSPEEGDFRRFDAGWGIMAGYQFESKLSLFLNYERGIINISRGEYNGINRTFSVNAMYPLSKIINTASRHG